MTRSNGQIIAPINVQRDIAYTLGTSAKGWLTLCSHPLINKWAKFKPYRSNSLETSETARANAHYGLSIPDPVNSLGEPGTSTSFLYKLMHGSLSWDFLPPRGNSANIHEYARIYDFVDMNNPTTVGYNHYAVCPIGDVVRTCPIDMYGNTQISWEMLDVSGISGNLSFADLISGLSDYYLAVLLYRADNNYYVVTSDNKIGSSDMSINISNASVLEGKWKAYPFFSSVQYEIGDIGRTGSYISAGWDDAYAELYFFSSTETVYGQLDAIWNANHTSISIEWYLYNDNNNARTVQPFITLIRAEIGDDPSEGVSVSEVGLGSITIPAKTASGVGSASGVASLAPSSNYPYSSSYDWYLLLTIPSYEAEYFGIDYDAPMEISN